MNYSNSNSRVAPLLMFGRIPNLSLLTSRVPSWSSGSGLDHRSLPPAFESCVGISEGCFIFDFASLSLEVAEHQSSCKTPIIIVFGDIQLDKIITVYLNEQLAGLGLSDIVYRFFSLIKFYHHFDIGVIKNAVVLWWRIGYFFSVAWYLPLMSEFFCPY